MDKKFIVFIIVAMVIIAFVAILTYFFLLEEKPPVVEGPEEIVPPPATGNIDDLVNALMKEMADIEPLLTQEDSDAALITNDSQEISDLGQSINENEF